MNGSTSVPTNQWAVTDRSCWHPSLLTFWWYILFIKLQGQCFSIKIPQFLKWHHWHSVTNYSIHQDSRKKKIIVKFLTTVICQIDDDSQLQWYWCIQTQVNWSSFIKCIFFVQMITPKPLYFYFMFFIYLYIFSLCTWFQTVLVFKFIHS